ILALVDDMRGFSVAIRHILYIQHISLSSQTKESPKGEGIAPQGETIKDILIPILPRAAQQKIAELVRQSHEARIKAKELLEEAKQKVEQLIEKGGERG
ncbi:MAG: hypothetical protein U1A28_03255, partial [Patescibacteria group bacterium]|nr:hypothetical protein [Patescibacteria group bacterium]